MFLVVLLLSPPVLPNSPSAPWSERPTNPRLPPSMGINLPSSQLLSSTNHSYLVVTLSWGSSRQSSHGTISSIMTMFLVLFETRRISGFRVEPTMCCRNLQNSCCRLLMSQPRLLSCLNKCSCLCILHLAAVTDPLANGVCNVFQHLVMAPWTPHTDWIGKVCLRLPEVQPSDVPVHGLLPFYPNQFP